MPLKQIIILFSVSFFQNGQITQERILVLFFFCSDVAILAIRQGATALVEQLTRWSLEFIKKQVKNNRTFFVKGHPYITSAKDWSWWMGL